MRRRPDFTQMTTAQYARICGGNAIERSGVAKHRDGSRRPGGAQTRAGHEGRRDGQNDSIRLRRPRPGLASLGGCRWAAEYQFAGGARDDLQAWWHGLLR